MSEDKDILKIVSNNIKKLAGDRSYRELADDIEKRTGMQIPYTTLFDYISGKRLPSVDNIKILAKYANKPQSWFYVDHEKEQETYTSEIKEALYVKEKFSNLYSVLARAKKPIPQRDIDRMTKIVEELAKDYFENGDDKK